MKFRKKAIEVEAMQLTRDNRKEVLAFIGDHNFITKGWDPVNVHIKTMDGGERTLIVGDYILKHAADAFEVLPREHFEMNYEKMASAPGGKGG